MCKSNNDSSLEKCYDFKSDTIIPDKFSKGNHNNYNESKLMYTDLWMNVIIIYFS